MHATSTKRPCSKPQNSQNHPPGASSYNVFISYLLLQTKHSSSNYNHTLKVDVLNKSDFEIAFEVAFTQFPHQASEKVKEGQGNLFLNKIVIQRRRRGTICTNPILVIICEGFCWQGRKSKVKFSNFAQQLILQSPKVIIN